MNDIVVEKLILLGRVREIAKIASNNGAWDCPDQMILNCFTNDPDESLERLERMQIALSDIVELIDGKIDVDE